MFSNVITREQSIKRNSLIENRIFYEQTKDELFCSVCIDIGSDIDMCNDCTKNLGDFKEKNRSYQSTYPIIRDAFKLIKSSLEKISSKCRKRCRNSLLNYGVHIGVTGLNFSQSEITTCNSCSNRSEPEIESKLRQKEIELKSIMTKYDELVDNIIQMKDDLQQQLYELDCLQEKNTNLQNKIDRLNLEVKHKEEESKRLNIEKDEISKFNEILKQKMKGLDFEISSLENHNKKLKNDKMQKELNKLQDDVYSQIYKSKIKSLEETLEAYMLNEIKKENELKKLQDEKEELLTKLKLEEQKKTIEALDSKLKKVPASSKRLNSCSEFSSTYTLEEISENKPQKVEHVKHFTSINTHSTILCLTSFTSDDDEFPINYVASGGVDSLIKIYNLNAMTEIESLYNVLSGHNGHVFCLHNMKNNNKTIIISGCIDGTIKIWDPFNFNDNELIDTLKSHKAAVSSFTNVFYHSNDIANERDSDLLVSGSFDKTIKVWDLNSENNKLLLTIEAHDHFVTSLTNILFNDSLMIVSGSSDRKIKVWNHENLESPLVKEIKDEESYIECLSSCIFNKNVFLLIGFGNSTIKIISLENDNLAIQLVGHESVVTSVTSMTMDNQTVIVSSSLDKTIKIWNPINQQILIDLTEHEASVCSVNIITKDDEIGIVSGSWDKYLKIWY